MHQRVRIRLVRETPWDGLTGREFLVFREALGEVNSHEISALGDPRVNGARGRAARQQKGTGDSKRWYRGVVASVIVRFGGAGRGGRHSVWCFVPVG